MEILPASLQRWLRSVEIRNILQNRHSILTNRRDLREGWIFLGFNDSFPEIGKPRKNTTDAILLMPIPQLIYFC